MCWHRAPQSKPARTQPPGGPGFAVRAAALWLAGALAAPMSLSAPASASASGDAVVVIVHKDNEMVVDRGYARQLYIGAVRSWPDGSTAFVLDQPDGSAAREQFSADVLGRSPANVRAIWAQNIFTGRGLPPKVAVDDEMKRLVAANRNAIGYVRTSQLDASVRVLLR